MKRFLPVIILLFCSFSVYAQTATPAQTLRLARATYEQGRLHEIEGQLVTSGAINDMNKQQKVEAYKILCLSYIYLEEAEKADEAMLNILRTDPYFEINENVDPAEFVALYYTFRRDPIYRIGAKLGGNFSRPNVQEMVSAVELDKDSKFKPSFGLQFGVAAEFPLFKKLTLHSEILYLQHRFQVSEKVNREIDSDGPFTNEFTGRETQNWISVPISVEYAYLNSTSKLHKKFRPYVAGGVVIEYLTSSKIAAERQREGEASIPESSVDIEREKINLSLTISTGIKIKMASGLFVADIRYVHGLTNVSSTETAFTNQKLLWEYGYADPVFKMSSFGATLSYVQDIFKPKKLRRKK